MPTAAESGKAFLAGVLAKLPESVRGQAEALFAAPEAADALVILGDGTLARSDYSRSMDEIRAKEAELQSKYTELTDWYTVNQTALQEAAEIKARGVQPNPNPTPTPQPTPQPKPQPEDTRTLVESILAERERDYAGFVGFTTDLAVRHYRTFGEELNTTELMADPRVGRPIAGQPGRVFSLQDAYQAKYGEKLQAKAKEQEEAAFEKRYQERRAAELRANPQVPYPIARPEPSPLDALSSDRKPDQYTPDSAAALYEQLQSQRSA